VISQTVLPALVFVPGIMSLRTVFRISAYGVAPLAWVVLMAQGKSGIGAVSFPPRPWLIFCGIWLGVSILHPNSYSLTASLAEVLLYISVFSPAFWAASALRSSDQIRRVLLIFFLCSAPSALIGLGQVFRPQTFNPPVIPALSNAFGGEDLMYETADGRKILRPCGLTDTPGAAAQAGLAAALIGLCVALQPFALWKRLACVAVAFIGVAVIYYSQARFILVMLVICLTALTLLLTLQRNIKQALTLTTLGVGLVVGSSLWVASSSGDMVTKRFMTLLTSDPGKLYQDSRGGYVQQAFEEDLWNYPLGYGMGWWGMIQAIFGDPKRQSPIWCEVMLPAWIYDGGFPLLIGYVGALLAAMYDSIRIALTCPDRELGYWAAAIVAFNLSVLATTFSYVPFLSALGVEFWMFAAGLHAADARVRLARRAAK
jgi:hypothetical protein